jgi:hypothetical protein
MASALKELFLDNILFIGIITKPHFSRTNKFRIINWRI